MDGGRAGELGEGREGILQFSWPREEGCIPSEEISDIV